MDEKITLTVEINGERFGLTLDQAQAYSAEALGRVVADTIRHSRNQHYPVPRMVPVS